MNRLTFTAVSRNYFNLPIWVAKHRGMLADEGLNVAIALYEGVDEVTNRRREGRVPIGYGITKHVILDSAHEWFSHILKVLRRSPWPRRE